MNEASVLAENIEKTASDVESVSFARANQVVPVDSQSAVASDWLKVGVVAVASAVLGGLAAAWFYRNTLSRFREAESEIPYSRITEDGSTEDF